MENITMIKPHYKRVLEEAKKLAPDLKESYALLEYIKVQNNVIVFCDFYKNKERVIRASQNNGYALELFTIFEGRKN